MQRKRAIWLGTIAGTSMVVGGLMWPIRQARQQEANRNRLFRAIQHDDTATVRALLEAGVDANARTREEVPSGLLDLVKITLHLQAQSARKPGSPALMEAVLWRSNSEIVHLLAAHGARVNTLEGGETPLIAALAAPRGQPDHEVIRLLLEYGANARHVDRGGYTALMDAAINKGDLKGLEFLVAAGCDPNARSRKGHTALTLARLYYHPAMFQALRKAGAVR